MLLKSKQLLIKLAKLSQREKKSSQQEITEKISQIKKLASDERTPKELLKKETANLEFLFKNITQLEKEKNNEIDDLKKRIKTLKHQASSVEDESLKKKVERLSHLLGDFMAKETIKKETRFEKMKQQLKKIPPEAIPLKKIDELQEKITLLKKSGKYPMEKIIQLEKRLVNLEKKLPVHILSKKENKVHHKILFEPKS